MNPTKNIYLEILKNLWTTIFYTTVMLWRTSHILKITRFWNKKGNFVNFRATVTQSPNALLTHVMPLVSFQTSWKHQKISGFPMLSEGLERDQWQQARISLFFLSNTYVCFKALVGLSQSTAKRWENNKSFYYIENVILVWTPLFSAGDTLKLKCSKRVYFVITILYLNI